jgi:catechol 2,3-dioxygenase-like lactoylglutathione lyase family enzyme
MADTLTTKINHQPGRITKTHGRNDMTADHVAQPWALRYTLIAVTDLERSIAFYRELGPFDEIARGDDFAILGELSTASIVLILREQRGDHPTRHGQQSLGLRSIAFNVGSLSELNRVESVLRDRDLFTSRGQIEDGTSEVLLARDPDNAPLVFVCYAEERTPGPDYYRSVASLVYSQDA